jgi:hypothetical protein
VDQTFDVKASETQEYNAAKASYMGFPLLRGKRIPSIFLCHLLFC